MLIANFNSNVVNMIKLVKLLAIPMMQATTILLQLLEYQFALFFVLFLSSMLHFHFVCQHKFFCCEIENSSNLLAIPTLRPTTMPRQFLVSLSGVSFVFSSSLMRSSCFPGFYYIFFSGTETGRSQRRSVKRKKRVEQKNELTACKLFLHNQEFVPLFC